MQASDLDALFDALEAVATAERDGRHSATAGTLHAAPEGQRAPLAAALRDLGYPDALRSPQALGMALRQLAGRCAGTRHLARTPSGRWYVRYGQPVAA